MVTSNVLFICHFPKKSHVIYSASCGCTWLYDIPLDVPSLCCFGVNAIECTEIILQRFQDLPSFYQQCRKFIAPVAVIVWPRNVINLPPNFHDVSRHFATIQMLFLNNENLLSSEKQVVRWRDLLCYEWF